MTPPSAAGAVRGALAFKKQPEEAAAAHSSLVPGGGVTCIDCHKGIAHTLPKGS